MHDEGLRRYLKLQDSLDPTFIANEVSEYAFVQFSNTGQVNEIVAECAVRIEQGKACDSELIKLVKGAMLK